MQKYINRYHKSLSKQVEFKDGWFLTGIQYHLGPEISLDDKYIGLRFTKRFDDINERLMFIYYAHKEVLEDNPSIIEKIIEEQLISKEVDFMISIKQLQININKRRIA